MSYSHNTLHVTHFRVCHHNDKHDFVSRCLSLFSASLRYLVSMVRITWIMMSTNVTLSHAVSPLPVRIQDTSSTSTYYMTQYHLNDESNVALRFLYIYVYIYVCIHICICMYVYMYICIYVCLYVCMYVCMCVCTYVCTCA